MYTLDFNPTALKILMIEIRWYAVIYALGFILLYLIINHAAKRKTIQGMDKDKAELFVIYSILGVVIGARLFYFVFYDISVFWKNPLEILMIWHAGLSFHGGLIGFIISAWMFSKKHDINMWAILDMSTIAAISGLMLGRIGNLLNGELAGTEFNGPWCTIFPLYDTVCRHPYPIYAFISHLILLIYLAVLLYINREKLKEFIGTKILAANFLIGYGILRIITDIWKMDEILLFMKTGQWLSVIMIIIGAAIMLYKKKR